MQSLSLFSKQYTQAYSMPPVHLSAFEINNDRTPEAAGVQETMHS